MATKKEVKRNMKINAICGVLCISLIGGTIYCMNNPELIWKDIEKPTERVVDVSETTDEEFQKILDNMHISEQEKKMIENNAVKNSDNTNLFDNIGKAVSGITENVSSLFGGVQLTGTDKNGNPYLKKGKSYTFKTDGTPVEAPSDGAWTEIVNPNNGIKYTYGNISQYWRVSTWEQEHAKAQAEARGEIDHLGNTDVKNHREWLESDPEYAERFNSLKWSVNVGSMNIK